MTMHQALRSRDDLDYICLEKKEEENLPALGIAQIDQYKDLRSTLKISKED